MAESGLACRVSPTTMDTPSTIVRALGTVKGPPLMQSQAARRANPKHPETEGDGPWNQYSTGGPGYRTAHAVWLWTMARKRMVSPELLTSESVASLPIPARYAFVGLWMYLDDEGRGKDNAALIRAHQWPLDESYTTKKVEADLLRFAQAKLICRYAVEGMSLLHCPQWAQWQKPNHPTPSRLAPCPLELTGVEHEFFSWDSRSPTGVLLESYLESQGLLHRKVVEVNSDKGSSSGDGNGFAEFRRVRENFGHSA